MKPLDVSFGLLFLTLAACCAGWLVRALFKRHLGITWGVLCFLALSMGLFLGIHFSAVIYDYEPGWRIVGFPMPAAYLKYMVQQNEWWDYISFPPPAIIAANFVFWTVVPFLILAPFAWLYIRFFRHDPNLKPA